MDKFNNKIIYLHKKQSEISGTIRWVENLETLYKWAKNNKEISRDSLYDRIAESGLTIIFIIFIKRLWFKSFLDINKTIQI